MAESSDTSKSWSTGARSAALIAAMLPVAAGIFQEAQDARDRRVEALKQRHEKVEQVAKDKEADAARKLEMADRADLDTSKLLQEAFVGYPGAGGLDKDDRLSRFCDRIHFASAQIRQESVSPRTQEVLIAAVNVPNRDGIPRICQCGEHEGARLSWFTTLLGNVQPLDAGKLRSRLRVAIEEAQGDCDKELPANPRQLALTKELEAARLEIGQLRTTLAARNDEVAIIRRTAESVGMEIPAAVIEKPVPATPVAACKVDPSGFSGRIRVFIQVPDEITRNQAESFQAAVNKASPFKAPGIQLVGVARSPDSLEIRYAYDQDRPAVEALQKALTGACQKSGSKPLIRQIAQYQGRVDPRVLEVWWPKPPTPQKANP